MACTEVEKDRLRRVDAYLKRVYGSSSSIYAMLRQALISRRALLLLDGLDEGGVARHEIERHVVEVRPLMMLLLSLTRMPSHRGHTQLLHILHDNFTGTRTTRSHYTCDRSLRWIGTSSFSREL